MNYANCPHCGTENSVDWISCRTVTLRTAPSYADLQKDDEEYHTHRECFLCGERFYIAGIHKDRLANTDVERV
jgi:ribosomal protein S27AE